MQGTLRASDVEFVSLPTAVFCVQCELISANNTPRCLACGSGAVLSLSRVLGGSLRGQQTAHLIADVELDRIVRSLLYSVPQIEEESDAERDLSVVPSFSSRHHLRVRHPGLSGPRPAHISPALLNAGEFDLEPGISIITEKAQALTGATGAAIALRQGDEIVCRAPHWPHRSRPWHSAADRSRHLRRMCAHRRGALVQRRGNQPARGLCQLPAHGRALDSGRTAAPLPPHAGSL